jgi:hypothetical protein
MENSNLISLSIALAGLLIILLLLNGITTTTERIVNTPISNVPTSYYCPMNAKAIGAANLSPEFRNDQKDLEKKLFGIPDFFIAFVSPIDANTFGIFGFGRGPHRWAWQPLKVLRFFKKCWRCTTLGDHISGCTWPIWARVCLLERSYSLL